MTTFLIIYFCLAIYFARIIVIDDQKEIAIKDIWEFTGCFIALVFWPIIVVSWFLCGFLTFKKLISPITHFFKN